MNKILTFSVLLVLGGFAVSPLFAEEGPQYGCSLRVGQMKADTKTTKTGKMHQRSGSETKTTRTTCTWPLEVSFSGKDTPDSPVAKVYYIGTHDGKKAIIHESEVKIELDEKRSFKSKLVSPQVVYVSTKTKRNVGSGRNRRLETKSTHHGDRLNAVVVQIITPSGDVIKSVSTDTSLMKPARTYPFHMQ